MVWKEMYADALLRGVVS